MVTRLKNKDNPLSKKAKKGLRGYPIATVAYYGPDSQFATKVAVGVIMSENEEANMIERWYSKSLDVRLDKDIQEAILSFIKVHNVASVVVTDGIIGCPHEEGKDYPEGEVCPECPYWGNRDRFLDEVIH